MAHRPCPGGAARNRLATTAHAGGGLPVFLPPTTTPPASGGNDDTIVASSTVAGQCAAPRGGINPATGLGYPDRAGSLANE